MCLIDNDEQTRLALPQALGVKRPQGSGCDSGAY